MPVIKRYPNRKLYDTAARQYIALDGVAALIRAGAEVQVVDHATGEDLTALILMQIIVEQEKRQRGFLPQTLLAGLVQAGDLAEDEGARLRDCLLASGDGPEALALGRALARRRIPDRAQVQALADQLAALEAELAALAGAPSARSPGDQ
jgi:polyhydroxyalkanoate synthesis repressor PhaR